MLPNDALRQYLAKLERRKPLPPAERDALLSLSGMRRDFAANETIVAAGDVAAHCVILVSGLASRTKTIATGTRQIVSFHIGGDAVDLQSVFFTACDHDIRSHGATRTYWVPHRDILALTKEYPILANALWLDTLVDSAIFREWAINVGQRNARQRIVHMFLELAARLQAIGLLYGDSYDLPITQTNLAEALGLSLVHLNKSLQALHHMGLVTFKERRVTIREKDAAIAFSGFSDDYLHLGGALIKPTSALTDGARDVVGTPNGVPVGDLTGAP